MTNVKIYRDKNKNIVNGYILEFDGKKRGKGKKSTSKKNKKISIKKLRKNHIFF